MPSQLAGVAIDAIRPRLVADFWCAVLGWHFVKEDTDIVSIAPRDATSPSIDVIAVPETKTIKNRLHFDLRADGVSTAEEIERLLALGAVRTDVGQGPDVSWVVLADPEGNEFCLLSRSVQALEQEEAERAYPLQQREAPPSRRTDEGKIPWHASSSPAPPPGWASARHVPYSVTGTTSSCTPAGPKAPAPSSRPSAS
ncbi:VOC family protein [Arthrobacter sp. UYEF3]|uniref:VOC family protein n=1 Tax=Arthrobacter sp. UYEF3 TaxID=1756365 RepID=UPI003398A81C